MARNKLTASQVKALAPGRHGDGAGLYLLVKPSGGRSWVYRFTLDRKQRDAGLGSYPQVTLAEARHKRDAMEAIRRSGGDPLMTPVAPDVVTVGDAIDAAFEARRGDLKGDGTAGRWMSPLKTHVLPVIGSKDIEAISKAELMAILRPIWKTKVSAAEKCFQRLRIVWRHARASGSDVDAAVFDDIEIALGSQSHQTTNIPSMPWSEVPAFYQSLGNNPAELCLKWLILTGCRSTPARMVTRAQIDGDVWTTPAALMKGAKGKSTPFRTPLPQPALDLIAAAPDWARDDVPLFSTGSGKPLSDMSLTAVLRRRDLPYRPHGFRASLRSWLDDEGRADWVVAETILQHVVGSKAAQAYRRSDLLERRRPLMAAWANYVTGQQVNVANVRSAQF